MAAKFSLFAILITVAAVEASWRFAKTEQRRTAESYSANLRIRPDGHREFYFRYKNLVAKETISQPKGMTYRIAERVIADRGVLFQGIFIGKGLLDCSVSRNKGQIHQLRHEVTLHTKHDVTSQSHKFITKKYQYLVDLAHHVRTCVMLHNKLRKMETKRAKRSILNLDWAIFPGTKWCGRGNHSTHYNDLGIHVQTDKCCRTHDHCRVYIPGRSERYGFYNSRYSTLSACSCDERFWSCLKNANSDTSRTVGDLYFNKMATPCFRFGIERKCMRRAWWGRCTKYDTVMKAMERQPLRF